MKKILEVCLMMFAALAFVGAQDPTKPVLRKGIHVELPSAPHAEEMQAADANDATVVTVTREGKMFLGTKAANQAELATISAGTVYVKADARVPVATLVAVMDALHGKSLVLLTEPPKSSHHLGGIVTPHGLALSSGGQ